MIAKFKKWLLYWLLGDRLTNHINDVNRCHILLSRVETKVNQLNAISAIDMPYHPREGGFIVVVAKGVGDRTIVELINIAPGVTPKRVLMMARELEQLLGAEVQYLDGPPGMADMSRH